MSNCVQERKTDSIDTSSKKEATRITDHGRVSRTAYCFRAAERWISIEERKRKKKRIETLKSLHREKEEAYVSQLEIERNEEKSEGDRARRRERKERTGKAV